MIGLGLLLVIQTGRLDHAKRDQIDPKTKLTWQSEYKASTKLLAKNTQNLEACNASFQTLSANVASQSSAVLALQASGEALAANGTRAVDAALKQFALNTKRTQRVAGVKETTCPALDDLRRADQ